MLKDLLDRAKRVAEEHLPGDVLDAGRKLGRSVAAHAPGPLAEVIHYVTEESEQAKAKAAKTAEPAPPDVGAASERCRILHNRADYSGAGVWASQADLTLENCTIAGNSADDRGGGLLLGSSSASVANGTSKPRRTSRSARSPKEPFSSSTASRRPFGPSSSGVSMGMGIHKDWSVRQPDELSETGRGDSAAARTFCPDCTKRALDAVRPEA